MDDSMPANGLSHAPRPVRPAPAVGPAAVVVAPPPAPSPLRVVAADPDPAAREFYRAALARLGHQVQVVTPGSDLVAACRLLGPDLIVTGPEGLAAADEACRERPVPVVLVADSYEPLTVARALAAGCVMACLPRPVGEAALGAAVAVAARRFREVRALRAEVVDLKQALEDRKVIERAKGAVMRRCAVGEDEAYRRLRKVASNANQKMADVARRVLAADAPFAELEAAGE
jgi:two-component system, response regulator PdtaR